MKKIFIIILIGIVFLTCFQTNIADSHQIEKGQDAVTLPDWKINDSWTYNGYYQYKLFNLFIIKLTFQEITFTVTEKTSDEYLLHYTGDVFFEIGLKNPRFQLADGTITGNMQVSRADLGFSEFTYNIDAQCLLKHLDLSVDYMMDPALKPLTFPFSVGDTWQSNPTTITQEMQIEYLFIDTTENDEYEFPKSSFECTSTEEITVPAGTYPTYVISASDAINIYYCTEINNILKFTWHDPLHISSINFELISTNQ